jgi:hypothetical protein
MGPYMAEGFLRKGTRRISSWPGETTLHKKAGYINAGFLPLNTFPLQSDGGPYISVTTTYLIGRWAIIALLASTDLGDGHGMPANCYIGARSIGCEPRSVCKPRGNSRRPRHFGIQLQIEFTAGLAEPRLGARNHCEAELPPTFG